MMLKELLLSLGAAGCLVSTASLAQGQSYWIDIKDPAELRALHSNKTHHVIAINRATVYFRADGKALLVLQNGERIARTWEIRGTDQVCYADDRFPGCRRFQRGRSNAAELHVTHEDGWDVLVKVEDGIPNF
jgi:hypothetical protein